MDPTTFRMMMSSATTDNKSMILVFNTTLPSATLVARVPLIGNHNVTINWGDGTTESVSGTTDTTYTRTYASTGQYTVRISGTADGFGDRLSTLSEPQRANFWKCLDFGDLGMTTLQRAFAPCINLIEVPSTLPSSVTNIQEMFYAAYAFNQDLDSWDTSSVTNMGAMFFQATSFNGNIGLWNTGNVTNMGVMFYDAPAFNKPIGNWNTANVTNMGSMFALFNVTGPMLFNQPIGNWNTANVASMFRMFDGAENFNQPIGNWNTANVANMGSMFSGATSFNQNIASWNTSNVTGMGSMFSGATAFNQNIASWNTANVASMSRMFNNATAFNQNIASWNTSNVTNMIGMFSGATAFNQNIASWNTSNVTNMVSMFFQATAFNQNIASWNTANVANMASMFFQATAFNGNIASWNTSNVTGMANMFTNATSFNQNIGSWNTSNVTNMARMFSGANTFNQNIGSWNTTNVANMANMFTSATAFNCGQSSGVVHTLMQRTATTGWRTQGISSIGMQNMFNGASAFAGNISNWCVTGISTAPTGFATGANANFTVARRPTWNACPIPDDGITLTFTDNWQLSTTTWGASDVLSIVWGGSLWVVGGASNRIATSPDGITWTYRTGLSTAGGVGTVRKLAWNGTRYVAGGTGFSTSTNGTTWTSTTGSITVQSLIWGGGQFIAGDASGTIATSPDGITWTNNTGLSSTAWGSSPVNTIAWNGSQYLAAGNSGRVATSPDGIVWTYRGSLDINITLLSSASSGGMYVIGTNRSFGVGTPTVRTSSDGITWSNAIPVYRTPSGDISGEIGSLIWDGARFVMAVSGLSSGGVTGYSLNGTTWPQNFDDPGWQDGINCLGWNGTTRYVVGGAAGVIGYTP